LQLVPFGALPVVSDDRSRGGAPLIVSNQVIMISSLSVLAENRKRQRVADPEIRRVGVIADPVYERQDGRLLASVGPLAADNPTSRAPSSGGEIEADLSKAMKALGKGQRDGYTRLFGAAEEAKVIENLATDRAVTIRTGFDATRRFAMSGELEQFGIIHFATHGMVNNDNPELSGLILSLYDGHGNRQEGFLRLIDIYSLRLKADLVVLSACDTALGRNLDGEGVIGLTRGFLYAGSRRVISTLWQVQDEPTGEFMAVFYQALLRDHLPPGDALRAAQVRMWNSKRWQSPYYWAAFVIYGD
jgi:CHAT domain-containing protein